MQIQSSQLRLPFLAFIMVLVNVLSANAQSNEMYVCFYYAPIQKVHERMHNVYQGVAHTTNDGETWVNRGWKTSRVNDIIRDDKTGSLYLSSDYGVLRSTDNGESWKQLNGWNIETVFRAVLVGNDVWLATPKGPYVSHDNGDTWVKMIDGLPELNGTYVTDIILVGTHLLISTADGVYESSDNGNSWKPLGLQGIEVQKIILHPQNNDIIAALSYGNGLYISANGGNTWESKSEKLYSKKVQSLAFHPENPDIIFIGTNDYPISKSTDGGKTWLTVNRGITNNNITAIAVDPKSPNAVYLGTENGTWVSSDEGSSWQPYSIRFGYVRSIKIMSPLP